MSVASVPAGGTRPAHAAKAAPVAQPTASSFAALLSQLTQSDTPGDGTTFAITMPAPLVDLMQFNVAASVSANAIRFDARPILGETSQDFSGHDIPLGESSSMALPEAGPSAALASKPDGIESLSWLLNGIAQQFQGLVMSLDIRAAQQIARSPAGQSAPGLAPSVAAHRRAAVAARGGAGASAPAQQPAPAAQTKALFAKLAMHPLEIRVVIHGAQLSSADLAALTAELTGLLAGTRFADRPIRILAAPRRS